MLNVAEQLERYANRVAAEVEVVTADEIVDGYPVVARIRARPDGASNESSRRQRQRQRALAVAAAAVVTVFVGLVAVFDRDEQDGLVTTDDRAETDSSATTIDNGDPDRYSESVVLPEWAVEGGSVPEAAPTAFEYRRDESDRILASLIDGRTMAIDADPELGLSERTPRVSTTAAYVDTGEGFELAVLWGTIEQNFGGRPILRVIDRGSHGGLLLGGAGDVRLAVEIDGWTVAVSANYTSEDRQDVIVEALNGGADPLTGFLHLTSSRELEMDYTTIDDSAGYLGPVLRLTNGDPGIHISPARCDAPVIEESSDGGYAVRCDPVSDTEVSAQIDGPPGARETVDGIVVSWLE